MVKRFLADRRGATAIEYGLIVALLSIAMIAGLAATGENMNYLFGNPESELQKSIRANR